MHANDAGPSATSARSSVRGFEGVAIRRATTAGFDVVLLRGVTAVSVTLGRYPQLGQALDVRDALARMWRLPALAVDGDGHATGRHRRVGQLIVEAPTVRRNARRRTRPRFLTRRKAGFPPASRPFVGREMIARD